MIDDKRGSGRLILCSEWAPLCIIGGVSVFLAYTYFTTVVDVSAPKGLALHQDILAHTAPAPYRHRVLVPYMTEGLINLLPVGIPRTLAFGVAYGLFSLGAFLFTLLTLYLYLRVWFSQQAALIAVLTVSVSMPVAMKDHYYQPWSLLEPGLFALALLLGYKGRYLALAFVVLVATLNRETAVVLPIALLCTASATPPLGHVSSDRRAIALAWSGIYLGIWIAGFVFLRVWLGLGPQLQTLQENLSANLQESSLVSTFVRIPLLLGAFWPFAFLGFRHAPVYARRACCVIPIYLVLYLVFGRWKEVRLITPLYPVLLPLALSYLYPPVNEPRQSAPTTRCRPGTAS